MPMQEEESLSVTGVANIKIASHSPALDNAIERLLNKSHKEIIRIAKETSRRKSSRCSFSVDTRRGQ